MQMYAYIYHIPHLQSLDTIVLFQSVEEPSENVVVNLVFVVSTKALFFEDLGNLLITTTKELVFYRATTLWRYTDHLFLLP